LEVQPPALHAIESGEKTITIYRSIALTAFGQQFIEVCTNTEGYNAGGWDTDGRQDRIRGEEKKHA
jgi:NADH:ubiquinone oxidoreductase subunit E